MLIPLLILLTAAQAAEPAPWRDLPSPEEEGTVAWRLAADDVGGGDARWAVMRVTAPDRGWAAAEMEAELACGAQTWTIHAARAFDAEGTVLRSVTATADQLRPEPIHADDAAWAVIYAELCPGGAPLAERPNHPPPVAVPVPRGG